MNNHVYINICYVLMILYSHAFKLERYPVRKILIAASSCKPLNKSPLAKKKVTIHGFNPSDEQQDPVSFCLGWEVGWISGSHED